MKRFADETTEEIYRTRFAKGVPEHISIAAHKIVSPLLAARSLQDVDVLEDIVEWATLPGRMGLQVEGKWHVTFIWNMEEGGAFEIRLERR